MDRNTLTNYGWVVIVIIILAVMVSLAMPFGSYIKDSVMNTITGMDEEMFDGDHNSNTGGNNQNPGNPGSSEGSGNLGPSDSNEKPPRVDTGINKMACAGSNSNTKTITKFKSLDIEKIIFEKGIPDYESFPDTYKYADITDEVELHRGGQVMAYLDDAKVLHICSKGNKVYLPENSAKLFYGFSMKEIDFNGVADTSLVTDMGEMFADCKNLKTIDFENLKFPEVTSIYRMFYRCTALEAIDLSNYSFPKLVYAIGTFYECSSLKTANLSNMNTPSLTNLNSMFYYCGSLENVRIGFKSAMIEDTVAMFQGSQFDGFIPLTITFDAIDVSKCSSLSNMFDDCDVTELDLSAFDTRSEDPSTTIFGAAPLSKLKISKNFTLTLKELPVSCEIEFLGTHEEFLAVLDGKVNSGTTVICSDGIYVIS